VGSRASTTQPFAQEKLCLSVDPATICVTVITRRWLTLSHDTSDRLRRVTATNFVAHTVTSQPGFCQARNAALTDTRMTLCASIMSRTCGPWPCGASGTDVGVNGISASHNKRVSRARAIRDPNRVVIRAYPQRLLLPICSRAITKNQNCSVTLTLLHRVAY